MTSLSKNKSGNILTLAFSIALSYTSFSQTIPHRTDIPAQGDPCVTGADPWYIGGNDLIYPTQVTPSTPPLENTIGTCNNYPFILKSNNQNSIFVMQNGNVAVGGTGGWPTNKLEVLTGNAGDGLRVTQYGPGAAAVQLNASTGHLWSFYALGTNDGWGGAGDLALQDITGNQWQPRLYIKGNSGNIGIGTYAPQAKLEVADNNSASYLPLLRLRSNNSLCGQSSGLEFWNGNNTPGATAKIVSQLENCAGSGESLVFETMTAGQSASSPKMVIKNDGKVGIGTNGTSFPVNKLDVFDATSASLGLITGSNNDARMTLANGLSGYDVKNDNTGIGRISVASGGINLISFKSSGVIGSSFPQVWIGKRPTIAPHDDFQLAVDGKVVAKSIYVTLTGAWADYVFEKNYDLPKLSDVESYYLANKHLPEVPNTAEVTANGIDLEKMNTVLLKKVEELTLYLVQQQKEIDALKNEINNK